MIRRCLEPDFESVYAIINDAACAYKGAIPADRWHDPYMPRDTLAHEISLGVDFWGCEKEGALAGVMGIQNVHDATLIRHAYVATRFRNQGIGGQLLSFLRQRAAYPILIGTWAAATWAVTFYQKHGFEIVSLEEKNRLLRRYWSIPDRQIETSVVLAESKKTL